MSSLEQVFSDIANSIRSKTGGSNEILPINMSDEIDGMSIKSDYILYDNQSIISTFNKSVIINNDVTNCAYMFQGCTGFNKPVTIPSSVTNCAYMFQNCTSLNKPVTIPSSVTNCYSMFNNCTNLNRDITIPSSVTNCYGMFYNCTNLSKNIYMYCNLSGVTSASYMFASKNYSKRIDVYTNYPETYNILRINNSYSIVGRSIIWTQNGENNSYNTTYNIYLHKI